MSRARNIKPGFFKNDLLVELAFEYRLLFVGLWTMADREGRLEDRPTKIRMEVFPADAVDVDAGLKALHDKGFILRYTVNGTRYVQVLTWGKHQNPHVKEAASTIPAPGEHGASTVQAPAIPERAGLIPDSGFLIPDSTPTPAKPAKAAPAGVDLFPNIKPQVVADFTALRRAKKAAITQTAVDGIRREATKAGMTLEAALAMCCERGWAGFKAEWLGGAEVAAAAVPGGGRARL